MRQPASNWRWSRVVTVSAIVGVITGLLWSGVVLASSAQPTDEGIDVDQASVRTARIGTDVQGVAWTLVRYQSSVGECLSLRGEFNGEQGSFGGCDPNLELLSTPTLGGLVLDGQGLAVAFWGSFVSRHRGPGYRRRCGGSLRRSRSSLAA